MRALAILFLLGCNSDDGRVYSLETKVHLLELQRANSELRAEMLKGRLDALDLNLAQLEAVGDGLWWCASPSEQCYRLRMPCEYDEGKTRKTCHRQHVAYCRSDKPYICYGALEDGCYLRAPECLGVE